MKIPETLIELAVSEDKFRPVMQGVHFDATTKRLIATDGHIMASVPVEADATDHAGIIPVVALKAARKLAKDKRNRAMPAAVKIACNGSVTVSDGVASETHAYIDGTFPNIDLILKGAPLPEGPPTIILDAELLLTLAKAIGPKMNNGGYRVALWIDSKRLGPAYVKASANAEEFGLIMPMRF